MGTIMQLATAVSIILVLFFSASTLYHDASVANGETSYEAYPSFAKINDYGNYYQNQTDAIRTKITASQTQGQNSMSPIELLYITMSYAGLAATGFFGFLDVGISLFTDASTFLGIPGFIVVMGILIISIKITFGIYSALRGGGKP